MNRARIQLEPAWVLKAAPYRDSSLLVEALTQSQGRVGLVARGARGPKSRTRVLLQAFQPLYLSWTESGDLGTLTGVEARGAAQALPGEQVFSGWYLNELLLRLLARHDAHAAVFEIYGETLAMLGTAMEPALRRFEMRLLAELGFGLDLPEDLDPARHYRHEAEHGVVLAAADEPEALTGASLIALRDERLHSPEELAAARQVLRAALAPHLGAKPLATASVLRELRRG